jgi:hypothetical protein
MEGREAEITFRFSIPPRLLRRVISLIRHGTPTIQLMQNTAQTNFQGGNKMQYDLMKYAEQNARRALRLFTLFVLCAFSAVVSWSQATQRFTGTVVDSTGAVIPEAQVVVHNQATGVDTKTVTTSSGAYTVTYLIPGTYNLTVSKAGFATSVKTDILLNVDQTSAIDFQLHVGATSQVVSVNASEAQIESTKGDIGEIIENARIQEMPLDARNPYGLFALSPGTHDFSSSQYPRQFDNVTGNQIVNGSIQPSQNNIDGIGNDAYDVGRTAFTPAADVVQEYKIVMNAYDASYGHSGGSSVDVSLKSGTNRFHGVGDYFMRRTWLDTEDWQSNYNGNKKAQHKRDQYSFTFDGPVVIPHLVDGKNKLFFVASYERMTDILPNPSYNTYSVPNPSWVTGDFSTATYWNSTTQSLQPLTIYDPLSPLHSVVDPHDGLTKQAHDAFPGNKIPSNRIDPIATKVLSYLSYVHPNANPGPGFAPWTNNYQVLQVENDLWTNLMVKIDYHPSDANMFSFRWAKQGRTATDFWNTCVPAADPANSNGVGTQPKTQTGAAQWTHVFRPNLLVNIGTSVVVYTNEALEGDIFAGNEVANLGFAAPFYNQIQSKSRFLNISSGGLPNAANFVDFGPGWLGYSGDRHALDVLPTVTYIKGAHTIRAGININFAQWMNPIGGNADNFNFTSNFTNAYGGGTANNSDAPGYASGMSIASLLLGYPNNGGVNWTAYQFWSQHYFAPWVQDDWKLTSKLSLNLGLRWDFTSPGVERHNKMNGVFNGSILNPVSSQIASGSAALGTNTNVQGGLTFAGVNGQSRGAYKMNMLDIQPRIGFAYSISDRMTIRGGIGETYTADQSTNGSDGFSNSTSYNSSLNNGLTPYTATTGQGLSNPIPVAPLPSGAALGYLQDLGKSFSFYNPHYHIPSVWSWSAAYEVALSRRDVVTVSYVGNRVPNNPENNNINQTSPQWNAQCDVERGGNRQLCDGAAGQIANPFLGIAAFGGSGYYNSGTLSKSNFTRPFPEFGDITENGAASDGKTWYHSIQAVGSHQLSNSLSLHASYTHAKALSSGGWVPGSGWTPNNNPNTGWVDQLNNVLAREVSTYGDVRHAITFSGVGILPFGRNRLLLSNANRVVDEIVNGWQISPLYTYYSGFAWRPTNSGGSGTGLYSHAGNWEMASTGGAINKPMGVSHTILPPDGSHKYSRIRGVTPCVGYKNTDTGAIVASPAATAAGCSNIEFVRAPNAYAVGRQNEDFGVRQPGAYKLDIAASKSFGIPEGSKIFLGDNAKLQIRVDLLNAFNHAAWDESYNTDPTSIDFGTIGKGPSGPTNEPRYLQLSAKLSW